MAPPEALRAAVLEAREQESCGSDSEDGRHPLDTTLDTTLSPRSLSRTLRSPEGWSSRDPSPEPIITVEYAPHVPCEPWAARQSKDFSVGDRVLARFKTTNRWYSAEIVGVNLDYTFRIKWDDGHSKDMDKYRTEMLSVPDPNEKPRVFHRFDRVLARYRDVPELLREAYTHRHGPWYHATVRKVLADGRYRISWCDGDRKYRVKRPDELLSWEGGPRPHSRRIRRRSHDRGAVHRRLFEDSLRRIGTLESMGGVSDRSQTPLGRAASPSPSRPSSARPARSSSRPTSAQQPLRPAPPRVPSRPSSARPAYARPVTAKLAFSRPTPEQVYTPNTNWEAAGWTFTDLLFL